MNLRIPLRLKLIAGGIFAGGCAVVFGLGFLTGYYLV